MKKLFLLAGVLIALGTLICGCTEKKTYRIGVSQCSNDDWRRKMNEEINRELIFHGDAEVEIRSAEDNSRKQIEDIRYFVENGYDILVIAPNEADSLTPVIKEVYEAGIPVLVFDREVHGDCYTAYQGADNEAIGASAAELAASLTGGRGSVVELRGFDGSTPARGRHEGFERGLEKYPGLRTVVSVSTRWDADEAARLVDSIVRSGTEIDLIYAHNDRMAIAAAEAVGRLGRKDVKTIGIDAAPEIGIRAVADSVIDATILYPTEGYRLIRTAMAILKGEPYERRTLLAAGAVVDSSNAEITLLQNSELEDETEKITWLKGRVDEYWSRHSAQTTLLYAVIAILVLLFGVVFLLLRAYWNRKNNQGKLAEKNRQLEEQRDRMVSLNEQLQEATRSKLMFFTNVSHDLRTPLTLIEAPVEKLLADPGLDAGQHRNAEMAARNVKILKRLVNKVLDFRKYENGRLTLTLREVNVGRLIEEWCESFRHVAVERDQHMEVHVEEGENLTMAVDVEKLESVMFNLISNALKYTPSNGKIEISARRVGERLEISVRDTGRGISEEDIRHIFERFYQVDKIHPNGSGIGLSVVKAIIDLHGGEIKVESEPGKGSEFRVILPVRHVEKRDAEASSGITRADVDMELGSSACEEIEPNPELPTVLVIDDNPDIRLLIRDVIGDDYTIIEASDGSMGLKRGARYVPDLIICDVMMPVMDGLECCRRLKEESATSHIPVLMLTACSMDEERIQGYECGADGYLSKPFNPGVLLARCRSLIANRRRLKNPDVWMRGSGSGGDNTRQNSGRSLSGSAISGVDNEFVERVKTYIEEHMGDAELSVDTIAAEMGLGRTQFYRKIKALTNYSPVELLRNIRLVKARALIVGTEKSISEIAYETGFSSPAYFAKCYRDRYKETPSETRGN